MAGENDVRRCVLGIDLGARSVGWALLRLDEEGEAAGIVAMGSRVFEAGVEGDIEQGKDESRAVQRRVKRQQRRMLFRRAQRQRRLAKALVEAGLLPAGRWDRSAERHELLRKLDEELRGKWIGEGERIEGHLLPYKLRAAAVKEKVGPFELGRAIYHLAQRRGYKSNRKTERKAKLREEEAGEEKKGKEDKGGERLGEVEGGIKTLAEAMKVAGCEFLGEYFATLDPEEARIRQRWTGRGMVRAEFERMIEVQREHHPELLTEERVKAIRRAIFFQRPLKSAKGLVGMCNLEEGKRRAVMALPVAQRFRMLTAVNNLEIVESAGTVRGLKPEERAKVIDALERGGGRTFEQLRTLLELSKTRKRKGVVEAGHEFNLERGGETRMPGDRTGSKLRAVFGDRWDNMPEEEKEKLVHELLNLENRETVVRRGREVWGLDREGAEKLGDVVLEDDYARYSKLALHKLVTVMEEGTRLATAEKAIYGEKKGREPLDSLPPVVEAGLEIRNPAVMRAMSELRKVVNGVVRKFGKPVRIVIELARDLKKPRKAREEIAKKNREREGERNLAAKEIVQQAGLGVARPGDIEKWLLAKECGMICPYTNRPLTPETLFGDNAQFDIEHIIPLSICLDNRLVNKTLCHADFNRHAKHDRIPSEAFEAGSEEWRGALERVARFNGPMGREKLRRFQMTMEDVKEEYGDDFTDRHLADTAFGSKLAAEYLGLLYGGINDADGKKRVFTSPGTATGHLRNEWQLNGILGGREKNRQDHRHHAVDAAVIAATTPRVVKMLSDSARNALAAGRRMFAKVPDPWAGFFNELKGEVDKIVVSHRMDRKVAGPLHAETNYSPLRKVKDAKTGQIVESHLKRVLIWDLTAKTVEDIVDEVVRERVRGVLNGRDPKVAFKVADRARPGDPNLPCMVSKDGRLIPIRKVRIRVNKDARPIGREAHRQRHIMSGADSLHHTVVVEWQTRRGTEWKDQPVDRLEAHGRLGEKRPMVKKEWGLGAKVAMVLCKGDCIEMDHKDSKVRGLFVVRTISKSDIRIRPLNDARLVEEVKKAGEWDLFRVRSADELRKRGAVKVEVSPVGEVAYVKRGA